MNRATRKANLKKLQDPNTATKKSGNLRRKSTRNKSNTATLTNYFPTPSKNTTVVSAEHHVDNNVVVKENAQSSGADAKPEVLNGKRTKRTILTSFVYKDAKDIPAEVLSRRRSQSDDFETPEKKIKKAPKLKEAAANTKRSARPKRQLKIKSAFLRNEEAFSQITAQHCIADNISPDDMQLALAISKSEAETSGILNVEAAKEVVVDLENKQQYVEESIRSKLQKYGFRTAAKEDYSVIATAFLAGAGKRRNKSKWANKFTALTLRDTELQQKKINTKIAKFLEEQLTTKPLTAAENYITDYLPHSSKLVKCKAAAEQQIIANTIENLSRYFVRDLFEVGHLKAGHLLKDWTLIQGRDLSPKHKSERSIIREQRLQQAFKDLQEYFEPPKQATSRTEAVVSTESKESLCGDTKRNLINVTGSKKPNELDEMLALIDEENALNVEVQEILHAHTANEKIIEGLANENIATNMSFISNACTESSKEFDNKTTLTTTSSFTLVTTQTATSPDIFADDSDIDMAQDTEERDISNSHAISTFEIFSSDEVKTFSAENQSDNIKNKEYLNDLITTEGFVDLTQSDESLHEISSSNLLKTIPSIEVDFRENQINTSVTMNNENNSINLDDLTDDNNLCLPNCSGELTNEDSLRQICSTTKTKTNDTTWQNLLQKYMPQNAYTDCKRKSLSCTQINEQNFTKTSNKYLNNSDTDVNATLKNFNITLGSLHKTPRKRNSFLSLLEQKSKSFTTNTSTGTTTMSSDTDEVSIDLTQNDNEDIDNDAFLMLSDDEINYSIWKADKSTHLKQHAKEICGEAHDLTLSSDSDSSNNDMQQQVSAENDFSFLDLLDEAKSAPAENTTPSKLLMKTASTLNFDCDAEPIASQFLDDPNNLISNGFVTPAKPTVTDLYKERAEFGILDSQSEPFTQSPSSYNTPCKISSNDMLIDDSFLLTSPSENADFMKRYSSSNSSNTRKYNSLLKTNETSTNTFDDFDEFDKLIYGSPARKKVTPNFKQPSDLNKLLTAKISFHEPNEHVLKTPIKHTNDTDNEASIEELEFEGKLYNVRLTNSPKPDFTKQTDAELLKRLYNYGIKPLKRKQAVKLLSYIYAQTHPCIIAETEQLENRVSKNQKFSIAAPTEVSTKLNTTDNLNLQDCFGDKLLRFSHELKAELLDEDYIFQTNISKKLSQALLPLHVAWFNLVCSSAALHESTLMFEPIDLQEIYLFFKSLGFRYEPKDLKAFFDRRCIIFRYDLAPIGSDKNRHVRKTKKYPASVKNSLQI